MNHTITLPDQTTFSSRDDEAILSAALRQQLNLPHSCKSGFCGQCKAQIVSGQAKMGEHSGKAISSEETAQGKILLCCATAQSNMVLAIDGYTGADTPPIRTLPARIADVDIRGDVALLTLALPKAPEFKFRAGQYIELLLAGNHVRSYSIANATDRQGVLELHIRRHPNGICSEMIFSDGPTLKEKSIVRIRGPLGNFVLQDSGKPIIMLATGTGYAPIRSMLLELIRQNSNRAIHLYWGGRSIADLYALEDARECIGRLKNARLTPVLSGIAAEWCGHRGYVQYIAAQDYADMSACEVYACGSPAMIESARHLLTQTCALAASDFYADPFIAAESL